MENDARPKDKWGWFRRLRRHPIFPILIFILASRVIGECYPISPFAMYSNPTTRPLHYYYVADEHGEALPSLWHSGISPSRIAKMVNKERQRIEKKQKKDSSIPKKSDEEIRRLAGAEVLKYVRSQSMKRKKRELKDPIKLYAIAVSFGDRELVETPIELAHLD